jgi:excisionase family DNA binding protein
MFPFAHGKPTLSPGIRRDLMERLLLRPVEAAEAIGISRSKIYELLASGDLPSVRIGASVRVPVEALRAWIAEQLDASRP